MTEQESAEPTERARRRRPLFWWPITLIALTTVLLLVADRVSAWHRTPEDDGGVWRRHADRVLGRVLDELEATDEQAAQIRAIADETFAQLAAVRVDRATDAEALRAAISAEPLDRDALEVLRRRHVEQAEALSSTLTPRLADALEVLTPDQRQHLIAHVDEFRAHHRDHPRRAPRTESD